MPTGQNINFKMDPLPLPDDTPVKNEEQRQTQNVQQASQVPRGAGFAPKSGQIAYYAHNILQGWMAGRHIQAEKKLNKAKEDVTQSQSIYNTLADVWTKNLQAGKTADDPEMQKLSKDIGAAWTNYVNTADKYTSPPDDGKNKKKSLGARIGGGAKKALMTNTDPELYRSASINILRQSGPPVLKESASTQDKAANAEAQDRMDMLKNKKEWQALAAKDPSTLSKDEQARLDGLERTLFPKTTEQTIKDSLLKKAMAGTQLSQNEREMAENMGILKPGVTNTLQWKDQTGNDYLIALDKDGKEVGRRKLGKGYVPPDQAELSNRMFQNQINALVSEYKRSFPIKPGTDSQQVDQDAHRFALMSVTGFKSFGKNPMEAERNQFIVDKALKAVIGEDKEKKAAYGNFVVSPQDDPNGLFFYRTNLVDPVQAEKEHWFWSNTPAQYSGGLTKDELPGAEREFRVRLRTALKKQNPKLSDDEINQLMPPPIYIDGGPGAKAAGKDDKNMSPTPEEKSLKMSNTPSAGGNHYRAVGPDGAVLAEDVTEAEMEIMKKDPRFGSVTYNSKTGPSKDDDLNKDLNRAGAPANF